MSGKKTWIAAIAAISFISGGAAVYAWQNDNGAETQPQPSGPPIDEMIAAAIEMAKPTEDHKRLEPLAGKWTVKSNWFGPDGAAIMTMDGTSDNVWILGNRFLQMKSTAKHEKLGFDGFVFMGYDARPDKQDFFALGIDTLGTYYVSPRGHWDDEAKSFILTGTESHDGMEFDYQQVLKIESQDRHTFTHSMNIAGVGEMKIVEATYTRVK